MLSLLSRSGLHPDFLEIEISHRRLLIESLHQVHVREAIRVYELIRIGLDKLALRAVEIFIADPHHVMPDRPRHNLEPLLTFLVLRCEQNIPE